MAFKITRTLKQLTRLLRPLTAPLKKQPTNTEDSQAITAQYIGRWYIIHPLQPTQHTLEIKEDLAFHLDQTPFPYTLISLSASQFVIKDRNGYIITITCQQGIPTSLHDEADDRTYHIKK